jgi:hypothetical protein
VELSTKAAAVLEFLGTEGRTTVKYMAAELDTTVQYAHHVLGELRDAGHPVLSTRGPEAECWLAETERDLEEYIITWLSAYLTSATRIQDSVLLHIRSKQRRRRLQLDFNSHIARLQLSLTEAREQLEAIQDSEAERTK